MCSIMPHTITQIKPTFVLTFIAPSLYSFVIAVCMALLRSHHHTAVECMNQKSPALEENRNTFDHRTKHKTSQLKAQDVWHYKVLWLLPNYTPTFQTFCIMIALWMLCQSSVKAAWQRSGCNSKKKAIRISASTLCSRYMFQADWIAINFAPV